jgi:hypothetical protein
MDERVTRYRARWGPIAGIIFLALPYLVFLADPSPPPSASGQQVLNFYANSSNRWKIEIVVLFINFTVVVGLFFFGYLRDRMSRTLLGQRFARIAYAAALLWLASGVIINGLTACLLHAKHLSPSAAQTLNVIGENLPLAVLGISICGFSLSAGIVILKSNLEPRWLGWIAIGSGVLAGAWPLVEVDLLLTELWVALWCYLLWQYEGTLQTSDQGIMVL